MSDLFKTLPGDEGLPGEQRLRALICVLIGAVLSTLDQSIVNVALPVIARDLQTGPATTIWVANAYQIVVAVTLLAFSGLGRVIGITRVFLLGQAIFTAGSLACALSSTLPALIAARVFQGIGAGAVMSAAPALNRLIFPNRALGSAIGFAALTVAASTALGPTVGGLILSVANWPWLFLVNLPLGGLGFWLAWRTLPRRPGQSPSFDFPGALLSGIGMGALVIGVDRYAHTDPGAGGLLLPAVAAVSLTLFVIVQKRTPHPLLPLDIFRAWRFSSGLATSVCAFCTQGLAFVALPFLFQDHYGYSALDSALLFTPWPAAIILIGQFAGRLSDRINPLWLTSSGLVLLGGGLLSLALLGDAPSPLDILWRSAVCGLGFGLYQAPNNREMMGNVPRERSGSAAGAVASARTFGQALGTAITALVLGAAYTDTAPDTGAPRTALFTAAAIAGLATAISLGRLRRSMRPSGHEE